MVRRGNRPTHKISGLSVFRLLAVSFDTNSAIVGLCIDNAPNNRTLSPMFDGRDFVSIDEIFSFMIRQLQSNSVP